MKKASEFAVYVLFGAICCLVGFLTGKDDGVNVATGLICVAYGILFGGLAMCVVKYVKRTAWDWWLVVAAVVHVVTGLLFSMLW